MIVGKFGGRIEYFRNLQNRGLFDNWNACLEYCATPWLSILHDDDLLHPHFVGTMLALAKAAPGRALYFGRSGQLAENGTIYAAPPVSWEKDWRDLDVVKFAEQCYVMFPGQLLRGGAARDLGGFRPVSYFTGDWDMWFRLALRFGAAQTVSEVSIVRSHYGKDRGTSRVERMGWKWALDNVQRKHNLALLQREKGITIPFERAKLLKDMPLSSRVLLRHAHESSRRILAYNWWLFTHSKPPHPLYAALQGMVWLLGPHALRVYSAFRSQTRLNKYS